MSYRKAEEILPIEIIELIQRYVDGENIYIPRREENKKEWGTVTGIKGELSKRNQEIYSDYLQGMKTAVLSEKYFLSEKSIQRIICQIKRSA